MKLEDFSAEIELGKVKLKQPVRYAISDFSSFPDPDPEHYLEGLFNSSADIIQWRERELGYRRYLESVRAGVRLSKDSSCLFIVNSDVELALEAGTDGVHLRADQDLAAALDSLGGEKGGFIIGKSAHSVEAAVAAEAEGADYVTLSPVYEPYSKEAGHDLLGLTALRNAAQVLSIPVFALGGLDLSRLEVVSAAGAAGIAGITWVADEITSSLAGN